MVAIRKDSFPFQRVGLFGMFVVFILSLCLFPYLETTSPPKFNAASKKNNNSVFQVGFCEAAILLDNRIKKRFNRVNPNKAKNKYSK
jgi:hypothetical protein